MGNYGILKILLLVSAFLALIHFSELDFIKYSFAYVQVDQ